MVLQHFNEALKIFYQILALENSKSIAITVWRKLVVAAYDRDPTLGEDLLRLGWLWGRARG